MERHVQRLDCYLQGQGHKAGPDLRVCVHPVSPQLLSSFLPNVVYVGMYIITRQSDMQRNWIVTFKVKVTGRVQIPSEYVCPPCIFLIRALSCQTWYVSIYYHKTQRPAKGLGDLQGQGHWV